MISRCSLNNCGSDGQESLASNEPPSSASVVGGGAESSAEIMLFGVRVRVDPMRKSVSLNNLSQYEHPDDATTDNEPPAKAAVDDGYDSADDAVHPLPSTSTGRGRKRGVAWTEEEHKLFLWGLENAGKGNWRGISRNYVKTRSPTQVASHAQKHFLRRTHSNHRRRRSSLFDITSPVEVSSTIPSPSEEDSKMGEPPPPPPPPQGNHHHHLVSSMPSVPPPETPFLQPPPRPTAVSDVPCWSPSLAVSADYPATPSLSLNLCMSLPGMEFHAFINGGATVNAT
ncbi:unnamed protein product [Cuscuta epithymum]|uniref:Uncharacterized protein n=1 Tax=Cuscuta epithymum TaxID=186058 RepID=A0AAV0C9L4_9ASTE|nr:unnamed protein product [Cuscuta epithymum]